MIPTALRAAVALAVTFACGGPQEAGGADAPSCVLVKEGFGPAGEVPIRVERVATGLEVPWGLAFLPDGDVLLTERPGRVRLLRGGKLEPEPVARVEVAEAGEGGLLGIAADPRFAENRRFYIYYTASKGGRDVNRLVRYVLAPDGRSAREDRILLDDVSAARFHDGGRIRFGPDGMLYVGTGDAGEPPRAQDPRSPNGKILRLTTDGAAPADNPTPGSQVFVSGVRNVEAFDWLDPRTLVIAEHGPSGELGRSGHDRVLVGTAGANFGWPDVYGCQVRPGMPAPALSWVEAAPPGGASVYRGDAVPAWKGSVLIGTLGSRHLHRVVLGADRRVRSHEVYLAGDPPEGLGRVREVVQGPDGALWVTTSNCDGRGTCPPEKDMVLRIVGAH
ncbi:PQQ-dependent sugar dehydrogenase [Anaeromyxobacter oryzisoli]|uniref:PQQ-dependent sugar dehydrogenase n=1 Tax=Anaeromyxobacter oryzisoli TaxID=2925408 RepID=UPI001F577D1F|nr:PQQ-dependent sugar dehydrogenase [Anaeromyxobacter sp. SG63]